MVLAISRRATLVLIAALAVGLGVWVWMGEQTSGGRRTSRGGGDEEGEDGAGRHAKGWKAPPEPGQDPDYEGPSPTDPWREGEFAQKAGPSMPRPPPPREESPLTRDAVARAIARAPGKVGYLASAPSEPWLGLLGDRLASVEPQEVDEQGLAIEALSWRLRGRGIDFLLVDTTEPVAGVWLDAQATTLRSRLRDALPMTHFHPVVRGATHTLYRVGPPIRITERQGKALLGYVRAKLAGGGAAWPTIDAPVGAVDGAQHRVALTLRSFAASPDHKKLGWKSAPGATLRAAVDAAIDRVRKGWPGMRDDTELPADLGDALERIEVEIDVLFDVCEITDRDARRLMWNLELGYDGAFLEKDGSTVLRLPSDALQGGVETEAAFVERLEKNADLAPGAWRDPDHRFGRFATLDFVEVEPEGRVQRLYRGNPLVRVSEITKKRLVRSLVVGARWLWRNQLPDGQFRYRYKPLRSESDRWQEGNNIVRHALNPYTLMLVNRVAPDERLVKSARRGLEYTFANLRRFGNRCHIWHTDVPAKVPNAKMGAVAVTILSLVAMSEKVDIGEYEDELRCLANQILYMQDRNGHFRQYDVPADHSYFGSENTIFPGEIMFALARMYTYSGEAKYKDAFDRAQSWYTAWWNFRSARRTEEGVYTEKDRQDLVGFVPWAVMALDAMHRKAPEQKYADFAFQLQDWMDEMFLWDARTTPYPDYLGAYYKRHDELPAINGCGYTEGAAAAFAIAKRVGHDVERRRRAVVLGVRFAMQLQYTWRGNTFWIPDTGTALGGYRFHLTATRLRNDYSYHAMSAIGQAALFLGEEDYPARRPIDLPEALAEVR